MAKVVPFYALRADANKVDKIAALPYDVYSFEEAKEFVNSNPLSFLRVDKPEVICSEENLQFRYEMAKDILNDYVKSGSLVFEKKKCYFIYELTMHGRVQTGVTGCVSIYDYINGIVRTHENTRKDKQQDRINHVRACSAQTGLIFMFYRADKEINKFVDYKKKRSPMYDFKSSDEIRHRVWKVSDDKEVLFLQGCFSKIKKMYIADGHHRAAAAIEVGLEKKKARSAKETKAYYDSDYFMAVLFPDDEVKVFPYNRIISDTSRFSSENIIKELKNNFFVEKINKPYNPKSKGNFGMYLNGEWYRIFLKNDFSNNNVLNNLDVSILQKYVFNSVFGVTDERTDERMNFVSGTRGLDFFERQADKLNGIGFTLYSVTIGEIMNIADFGLRMPSKSTWFEPKLRSGMFVHLI